MSYSGIAPGLASPFNPHHPTRFSPALTATPILGRDGETPHVLQRAMMEGQTLPESPVIDGDMRMGSGAAGYMGESSTSGYMYSPSPEPRFLSDPSPQTIYTLLDEEHRGPGGEESELRTALILRRAIHWGVERGDVDLVNWLVTLGGKWGDILDREVQTLEDDEGWGVVGMAIQCSCGRQDKEEAVRAVVQRWGLEVGPRGGKDRTGWTSLHLAVLLSTPPLVSFLLSHGASPHLVTNRGLTPLDIVSGIPDRETIALFLEHAISVPHPSTPISNKSSAPQLPHARQKMLARRRRRASRKMVKIEQQERSENAELEKEKWVRERIRVVEVDPELVVRKEKIGKKAIEPDHSLGWAGFDLDLEEEEAEEESDHGDDEEIGHLEFNSNMLVFSLNSLPEIFDILISEYVPVANPISKRTLPANALFYYARYAWYMCDETWLEALIEGAVERIEEGVYSNMESLAYLAFWAYNSCVLLHHLQSDEGLQVACEDLGLSAMLEELINAIHVFVIRIAERRIDAVLDSAILDYETLEDFNDIRFEGEWSLFRSFVPRKKREMPKASSIFQGSPGRNSMEVASSSVAAVLKPPNRPQSMSDLKLGAGSRPASYESNHSSATSTPVPPEVDPGPGKITEILTGVLVVLQLYDVNPSLIVQAISQIYFWIACELFNRVLTRKKYLCRSKAMQIRMNLASLDDWIRFNGLPAKTSTQHLAPVLQLLQWLQCQSQIRQFDTLIGTMQNMKAINPLQMRRAVRDYRYEVHEGRMTDECLQYLVQLQKDWEKRRLQVSVQDAERRKSQSSEFSDQSHGTEMSRTSGISQMSAFSGMSGEEATVIDALFDGTTVLADFTLHSAPISLGDLLDSRYMLPFYLPSETIYLAATPPADAAYINLHLPTSPFVSDTPSKRPLSRASFSSSRPMGYRLPTLSKLRGLPLDFFKWVKEREVELKLSREDLKKGKRTVPAMNHPLSQGQGHQNSRLNLAVNTAIRGPPEDKNLTPTRTPTTATTRRRSGNLMPPPALEGAELSTTMSMLYPPTPSPASPALRSSISMNDLKAMSKVDKPFYDIEEEEDLGHVRSESFELKERMRADDSGDSASSLGDHHSSPQEADGRRKRWWNLGSGETPSPDSSFSERRRRDASEDTIGPDDGWVASDGATDVKTPEAKAPTSAKRFWS